MEILLTAILVAMIAILYNYGRPKFDSSSFGKKFSNNFYGNTAATAIVLFVAILLASFVGGMLGIRSKSV